MQSLTKQTVKIFWQHSKKYPWHVAASLFCLLSVTALRTFTPFLYKTLINLIATTGSQRIIGPMIKIVVVILLVNSARVFTWRGFNFINNYFQPKVMDDLLNTCYQYLQKHSFSFFSSSFVGSLVTKAKRYERSFEQITDQIFFSLGRSLLEALLI